MIKEKDGITIKLTVLGNNGTCPAAGGACSCYLLEVGGKRLLLDAGNGGAANLQRLCGLAELDGIVISHLHFDHMADLFPIKYALETRKALGESVPVLPLWLPAYPQWVAAELEPNGVFDFHIMSDGVKAPFGACELRFSLVRHLVDSFAVRVEGEGKVFAYSADSGECPALTAVARGAGLFLCESTFLEDNSELSHHLSVRGTAETARAAGVERLLLTHFSEPGRTAEYEAAAQEGFPGTRASRIGETVEF